MHADPIVYYRPGCVFAVKLRAKLRLTRMPYNAVRFGQDEAADEAVRNVNNGNEISPTVQVGDPAPGGGIEDGRHPTLYWSLVRVRSTQMELQAMIQVSIAPLRRLPLRPPRQMRQQSMNVEGLNVSTSDD